MATPSINRATPHLSVSLSMPKATANNSAASTMSFWDKANAQLDPRTRKCLANVNVGTGSVIDAVLKEALAKQKAFNLKKWKIVIRGKDVVLSDIFDRIVRWVDHFKIVVCMRPSHH
jgi:hypothetical protein